LSNNNTLLELQRRIGYEFKDASLLFRAITHSSAITEGRGRKSYERLEYLGDAVLELLVTRLLFSSYPKANEGQMTRIRAAVVSEKPLAEIANELGLGEFLILGHGMDKSGGRSLSSVLSDVVEAIIAAVYLDGGIDMAEKFIMPYMMPNIEVAVQKGFSRDYKTRLQEFLQRDGTVSIKYKTSSEGPAHDKIFSATVYLENELIGEGTGKSKKLAQQQAAKNALKTLGILEQE
jgi:ribonuclease-3